MLLLEDFGEYFYNFNGTSDASGGGSGSGVGAYGNFSGIYDPLANCSLANTTCGEVTPSKCRRRDEGECKILLICINDPSLFSSFYLSASRVQLLGAAAAYLPAADPVRQRVGHHVGGARTGPAHGH